MNKINFQGIESCSFRILAIKYFILLADEKYIERRYGIQSKALNLGEMLYDMVQFFFDDLNPEENCPTYRFIGFLLRDKKEADLLYNFSTLLDKITDNLDRHDPNLAYISSPYWPLLVKSAQEAAEYFLYNERDNRKFMSFISEIKKDMEEESKTL